jgi:hypothetical protein
MWLPPTLRPRKRAIYAFIAFPWCRAPDRGAAGQQRRLDQASRDTGTLGPFGATEPPKEELSQRMATDPAAAVISESIGIPSRLSLPPFDTWR